MGDRLTMRKIRNLAKIYRHEGLPTTVRVCLNNLKIICQRRIFGRRFVVKYINGNKMYLDLDDRGISRTLALFGTREKDQLVTITNELKEGMAVLDIGANIGTYALFEARIVGARGKVYAIEPSPENFALLNRNVNLNKLDGTIQTFQAGISDRKGTQKLYLSESSNLHTFCLKGSSAAKSDVHIAERAIDVDTFTISEFVADRRPIDFIRMDIEGYEVEAFRGMIPALEAGGFSPMVLFETHRSKYDDNHRNMRDALERLFSLGFFVKTIISDQEPKGEFRNLGYQPRRIIKSDFVLRGIYDNISREDALYFICDVGFVRAVLLEKEN